MWSCSSLLDGHRILHAGHGNEGWKRPPDGATGGRQSVAPKKESVGGSRSSADSPWLIRVYKFTSYKNTFLSKDRGPAFFVN